VASSVIDQSADWISARVIASAGIFHQPSMRRCSAVAALLARTAPPRPLLYPEPAEHREAVSKDDGARLRAVMKNHSLRSRGPSTPNTPLRSDRRRTSFHPLLSLNAHSGGGADDMRQMVFTAMSSLIGRHMRLDNA
jgi:hypothetical protein